MVNFLVTREGLSADTVYAMTKAIFANLNQLVQTHPAARGITVKDAATGMPLPLHPGAERYYREIGLLKYLGTGGDRFSEFRSTELSLTSEPHSSAAPAGRARFGLRGRLLLAFVGISMFTVVAGLSGHYAFNAVTRALDRTGATIPPALAAVELTRETDQVLSAGPRMLNARSEDEVERLSRTASSDLQTVSRLVDELRITTVSPDVLDGLSSNVSKLRDNLSNLKVAATERVQAAGRRESAHQRHLRGLSRFRHRMESEFRPICRGRFCGFATPQPRIDPGTAQGGDRSF